MVVRVDIKVHGLEQIEKALKELGVQASNRIARSALNRGATPVVKRAREGRHDDALLALAIATWSADRVRGATLVETEGF